MAKKETKPEHTTKKAEAQPGQQKASGKGGALKAKIKHLFRGRKRKIIAATLFTTILLGLLYVVPATRYGILGNFIKKDVVLTVTDTSTKKPVSEALVEVGGISAKTGSDGRAKLSHVAVGEYMVKISKKYYKTTEDSYTVPVFGSIVTSNVKLKAIGRQVTVTVNDKIKQTPLAKVLLTVGDTSARTDDKGIASIVLPADKQKLSGSIELEGYNKQQVEVRIGEQTETNLYTLVPAGKLFYLSKQTGKINVMESNLDGSDAKVIVEGTGKEQDGSTRLLPARDWEYLVLQARRDASKNNQLYLVNTKNSELKLIDEGEVAMQTVGWSGHRFIYKVTKLGQPWEEKSSLKSYDAKSGRLARIDESQAISDNSWNYQTEAIAEPRIINDKIIYVKYWSFGYEFQYIQSDKKMAIMSINPDGSSKQRLREFTAKPGAYISARLHKTEKLYFMVIPDNQNQYFEYASGGVKPASINEADFYGLNDQAYLLSQSGKRTFWTEPRDGKNTLFVGDVNGDNSKQLASLSDYVSYGWYGDEYVLLSKNSSELYIAAADKPFNEMQPLKITNYQR